MCPAGNQISPSSYQYFFEVITLYCHVFVDGIMMQYVFKEVSRNCQRTIMKFIFICIFLITLFSQSSESQTIKAYGLKIGAVSATQSFNYTTNFSLSTANRWGIDVGGSVELLPTRYFSLLTEIHFIQKGFSFSSELSTPTHPEGTGIFVIIKPRLDYLSIPILAKIRFENDGITPYLIAGPRFDFLLGEYDTPVKYTSSDFGATFGGGFEWSAISVPIIIVEGRFSPSFTYVFQNQNVAVKNNSFEILIGAMF